MVWLDHVAMLNVNLLGNFLQEIYTQHKVMCGVLDV